MPRFSEVPSGLLRRKGGSGENNSISRSNNTSSQLMGLLVPVQRSVESTLQTSRQSRERGRLIWIIKVTDPLRMAS